ncbi:DUF6931 family protein [Azospirillum picis]|uniref:Secreted protein n=1 Tax=Azospirillum picis TaxID=488438 RepID=A0ABU0MFR7_9PROT|nr:hypothetical protein [Azospirillum picis]MBP2298717.1 hypothetical protein [Azospirillum picis]MDQ0532234.1 hypothetical protein [Azospirillum picis]
MPKLRFARAAEAVAGLDLSPEAKALLSPGLPTAAFLKALIDAELYVDAIRLLGMALPRREAVWWGCLAARGALPADAPPADADALAAAEAWVFRPSEENRRAAFAPAQAANFETACAYAAMGAFWSGGSLAPPDAAVVVPPGDGLTGTAAAAAVLMAAAAVPKEIKARQKAALVQALDIANGGSGKVEGA